MSAPEVTVRSGYRLHLGFYRFKDLPFIYGGLGISLETPELLVSSRACESLEVKLPGPEDEGRYFSSIVRKVVDFLSARRACLSIGGYLRRHVGLGSTTRVTMAVLQALASLSDVEIDLVEAAHSLGRGKYSGIGIYTFIYGNLVVDSGILKTPNGLIPPSLLGIHKVPRRWYVVVATPYVGKVMTEQSEENILEEPEEFEEQKELYANFVKMLAGLSARDLRIFGEALSKLQELTGKYFSRYQGGTFCCEESEDIINIFRESKLVGTGQSSWGPTVYAFTDSYAKALEAKTKVREYLERRGIEGDVWITKVSERGHEVRVRLAK